MARLITFHGRTSDRADQKTNLLARLLAPAWAGDGARFRSPRGSVRSASAGCSATAGVWMANVATETMSVLPCPAGEPGGDLLELPGVAVRVAERGPSRYGALTAKSKPPGGRASITSLTSTPRPTRSSRAASMSSTTRIIAWAEPGSAVPAARAELDRAPLRMRRRELHRPQVVADDQVDVEPPAEAACRFLRSACGGSDPREAQARGYADVGVDNLTRWDFTEKAGITSHPRSTSPPRPRP